MMRSTESSSSRKYGTTMERPGSRRATPKSSTKRVEQDRIFDRERQPIPPFVAGEEAVGIDARAVEDVGLQDRLAKQQRTVVVGTAGDSEDRANARSDGEDRLPQSPSPAIDLSFVGAPDVTPEVEEVVPVVLSRLELGIDVRITGQSACAEVFDEQVGRCLVVPRENGVNRLRDPR